MRRRWPKPVSARGWCAFPLGSKRKPTFSVTLPRRCARRRRLRRMRVRVDGQEIFAGTGGRPFAPGRPTVVFLHGAGADHSVWALLARAFAYRGFGVLAPDFPGHDRSAGAPLGSIAEMADWTAALLD